VGFEKFKIFVLNFSLFLSSFFLTISKQLLSSSISLILLNWKFESLLFILILIFIKFCNKICCWLFFLSQEKFLSSIVFSLLAFVDYFIIEKKKCKWIKKFYLVVALRQLALNVNFGLTGMFGSSCLFCCFFPRLIKLVLNSILLTCLSFCLKALLL